MSDFNTNRCFVLIYLAARASRCSLHLWSKTFSTHSELRVLSFDYTQTARLIKQWTLHCRSHTRDCIAKFVHKKVSRAQKREKPQEMDTQWINQNSSMKNIQICSHVPGKILAPNQVGCVTAKSTCLFDCISACLQVD